MKIDKPEEILLKIVGGISSLASLGVGFFLFILLALTGFENSFFTLIMRSFFLLIIGIILYLNVKMWNFIKKRDFKKLLFILIILILIIIVHFDQRFYEWFFDLFF